MNHFFHRREDIRVYTSLSKKKKKRKKRKKSSRVFSAELDIAIQGHDSQKCPSQCLLKGQFALLPRRFAVLSFNGSSRKEEMEIGGSHFKIRERGRIVFRRHRIHRSFGRSSPPPLFSLLFPPASSPLPEVEALQRKEERSPRVVHTDRLHIIRGSRRATIDFKPILSRKN